MKQRSCLFWIAGGIFLCCLVKASPVKAQVSSDGTLSTNVTTTDNLNFTITNGDQAGSNLFHSFSKFSVPTGGSAFFNNASEIQNIISRVTGGLISNIDGLIRANGTTNLFLLNPNGIIFGPNGSLMIDGSFLASTASSLNFADGNHFSATDSQATPLLTVNVPIGLQFGDKAGRILVQGQGQGIRQTTNLIDTNFGLRVQPGQTLALVGDNVALEGGTLKTAGGRIELGSVAGSSLVSLTSTDKGWALRYEGVQNFRDIQLSQQTAVDASGAGGGDIQVRGRRVMITDGSQIEASTLGSEPGGTLAVTASESVELIGYSADNNQLLSGLYALVYPGGTGAGGSLTLETERLNVRDGAQITASTFGTGNAGVLIVRASDLVELSGEGQFPSGLFTQANPESTGYGGDLTIETERLIVQGGAQIAASTFGTGNAGDLIVRASDSVELSGEGQFPSGLFAQANPESTGDGGDLTIETGRLIVQDGAGVAASTFSIGNAGDLIVRASHSVELSGEGQFPSSLFAQAEQGATGPGGNLTIETGRLNVWNGAQIGASTFGTGNAGALIVRASDSVELSGEGLFPTGLFAQAVDPKSTAAGGNLTIETRRLSVRDGAGVAVTSLGTGKAGNLIINSDLVKLDRGTLTAETQSGEGGDITIQRGSIQLRNNSFISTEAGGSGNGGNITINADTLVGLENSDIVANAFDGEGGFIQITAQGVFGIERRDKFTENSDITAFSQKNPELNGVVEINTPDVDTSIGLVTLPTELVDASRLIASGCRAAGMQGESEFIVTGRGGLPPSPSDTLSSDTVWSDLRYRTKFAENITSAESANQQILPTVEQLVEAQGWVINNKGEVVLTATVVPALPHSPWQSPAECTR